MDYLPVCLKLRGRRVLLVGGGVVATRKAQLLVRAGAVLDVLAPEVSSGLKALLIGGPPGDPVSEVDRRDSNMKHQFFECSWDQRDLQTYAAVVATTPDRAVNADISSRAQALNVPVNVVDDPALCSFILPAIIDRNPLLISVSSSGSSPVLARRIRSEIETRYPPALGDVAAFLGRKREQVINAIPSEEDRRVFWESLIDDSALATQLTTGDRAAAEDTFREQLHKAGATPRGAVYLIGAGPGDPDLMTFKALRLLQRADVVLYDRLVGSGILELARRDAEKIYVGKQRSDHAMPQSEINDALLRLALEGKRVARLKGGDPFIFGRGGEEIEGLMNAGVHFEVVPGITAASGAACYGGIPLTHRDYAQSVRFITGHTKDHKLDLPWESFLNPKETLVFYMGLAGLSIITQQLIAAGRRPDTPTALVEKATLPEQRVLTGTLDTIESVVEQEKPGAPTLLIIGDVVRLHPTLGWFGSA